jgi:hypothetical protein
MCPQQQADKQDDEGPIIRPYIERVLIDRQFFISPRLSKVVDGSMMDAMALTSFRDIHIPNDSK